MSVKAMLAVAVYIAAINLAAYVAMLIDKANARSGLRRISEATLLSLALIGGSVGTVIAQQTVRHKTHKEPFRSHLIGIIVLQVIGIGVLAIGIAAAGSLDALLHWLVSLAS